MFDSNTLFLRLQHIHLQKYSNGDYCRDKEKCQIWWTSPRIFYKVEIHQALLSKLLSEQNLSLEMCELDTKIVSSWWIPQLIYKAEIHPNSTITVVSSIRVFLKWNGRLSNVENVNPELYLFLTWHLVLGLNTTQKLIQTFLPFKNLR